MAMGLWTNRGDGTMTRGELMNRLGFVLEHAESSIASVRVIWADGHSSRYEVPTFELAMDRVLKDIAKWATEAEADPPTWTVEINL